MATQLDLFDHEFNRKEAIVFKLESLQNDIDRMRRSFFVRLDAQEKKCQSLIKELEHNKI